MPVKKKVKEVEVKEDVVEVSELEKKRNALIDELKPRLLTKSQLKRGGGNTRSRHIAEQGYLAIVEEINELGKEIGLPPVGFDSLRKE